MYFDFMYIFKFPALLDRKTGFNDQSDIIFLVLEEPNSSVFGKCCEMTKSFRLLFGEFVCL